MKNRKVIEDLYFSYIQQKKNSEEIVSRDQDKVLEISKFLESLDDNTDRQMFSPFDTDYLFDGRVELEKKQLSELNEEIKNNLVLIDELNVRISQFKEILDDDDKRKELGNTSDFRELVLSVQENERKRMSSELHDVTVQNLVHVNHSIELASLFIDQDPLRAKLELEGCIKNIKNTIDGLRTIIYGLRPMAFDDLDFVDAVKDFTTNILVRYPNIDFELNIDSFDAEPSFKLVLFRIVCECITNAVKHSKSNKIIVNIKKENDFCYINIIDYGIGFDINVIPNNHFGISILKERVRMISGTIDINSVIDEGTNIKIVVPIGKEIIDVN